MDYAFDPITGIPIQDPSGVLQARGYETSTADAALGMGDAAAAGVSAAAGYVFTGLKVIALLVLVAAVVVVVAETRKAFS